MAAPLTVGLAPDLELTGGYVLRITALDPSDGSTVTSVIVSDATIQTEQETPEPAAQDVPEFVPLFTYGTAA